MTIFYYVPVQHIDRKYIHSKNLVLWHSIVLDGQINQVIPSRKWLKGACHELLIFVDFVFWFFKLPYIPYQHYVIHCALLLHYSLIVFRVLLICSTYSV